MSEASPRAARGAFRDFLRTFLLVRCLGSVAGSLAPRSLLVTRDLAEAVDLCEAGSALKRLAGCSRAKINYLGKDMNKEIC